MKSCIFVAAGDISDKYCEALMEMPERPFVFAVDGGYEYLVNKGCKPDMAIGDFDSLGFVPKDTDTVLFPVRKDKPDMQLAVDKAIEMGFDTAFVLGAFGGRRLDHTYANFQTALYALPSMHILYFDDNAFCCAVEDEKLCFREESENGEVLTSLEIKGLKDSIKVPNCLMRLAKAQEGYLSLFAADSCTADISGCSYSGEKIELKNNNPLGVSNYISEKNADISIRGRALLFLSGRRL